MPSLRLFSCYPRGVYPRSAPAVGIRSAISCGILTAEQETRHAETETTAAEEDRRTDRETTDEETRTGGPGTAGERRRGRGRRREESEGPERDEDERTREDRQSAKGEGIKKIYGGIRFSYSLPTCYP